MREVIPLCLVLLTAACRDVSQIARGLYSAVVQGSNAPPSAERDSIRARGAAFVRELPDKRLVIVPFIVVGRGERYDTLGAVRLAEELRSRGITKVRVDSTPLRIPVIRHPNQLFIFWTRFKALAAYEAEHPRTDTDYVLLVDVMGAPEQGMVGAVHAMGVTADGVMMDMGFWNSHHELYKRFQPKSLDDVAGMVAAHLTEPR